MKTRINFIVLVLLAVFSSRGLAAQTSCPEHFAGGQAPDFINQKLATKAREVCYSEFGVLHSGVTRTPLYAADHLTRERMVEGEGLKREGRFHPDGHIPAAERAELHHYAHSEFDRGHMAPAGDMSNRRAQNESFSLANIVPQAPSVNRGVWERIETAVRRLARYRNEFFVLTGPIYQGENLQSIGGAVMVPTALFKVVYDPRRKEAGAYLVENTPGAQVRVVSVAEVEKLTGLNLLPAVDVPVKEKAMRLPMPKTRHEERAGEENP